MHVKLAVLLLTASALSGCSSCVNRLTSGDSTTVCRELAKDDPYVEKTDDAEKAYSACSEAAQSNPDDPEIAYLLASSALETERMQEAIQQFQRAEQLGNCKALYFLGDNAWYAQQDEKTAEAYYRRGAECGDERAARQVFSKEVFQNSEHPEFIEALYNSEIDKLNRYRFVTASYVYGFYKELGEQFLGKDFETCWKATHFRGGETLNNLMAAEKGDASNYFEGMAYEKAMPFAFQLLFPDLGEKALDERREAQREAGRADVLRMVESSECSALLPHKILAGVEKFASAKRSLFDVVRAEKPNINSIEDVYNMVRPDSN